jgi:hypothetical protein
MNLNSFLQKNEYSERRLHPPPPAITVVLLKDNIADRKQTAA